MALQDADLFVVQKQPGSTLAKLSFSDLKTEIEAADTVTYKGVLDFTSAGDDPSPANVGDLYINSQTTPGPFAWANGPNPAVNVSKGSRCIWNGGTWDVFSDGIEDAGVESVVGGVGITVNEADAANPIVDADIASTSAVGVVMVAEDADVTAGNEVDGGSGAALVVTASQLRDEGDRIEALIGAAGGGTVTTVTGDAPIDVTNNSTTPRITVAAASTTAVGVVQYATDDEVTAGVATDKVVTPAQLGLVTPDDLGVETISEGGTSIVSGALQITDTAGAVTIGVNENVFCTANFTALPEA